MKKPIPHGQVELRKAFEDKTVELIKEWGIVERAYVYLILHKQGLKLDMAEAIISKAVFEVVDYGREIIGEIPPTSSPTQ